MTTMDSKQNSSVSETPIKFQPPHKFDCHKASDLANKMMNITRAHEDSSWTAIDSISQASALLERSRVELSETQAQLRWTRAECERLENLRDTEGWLHGDATMRLQKRVLDLEFALAQKFVETNVQVHS